MDKETSLLFPISFPLALQMRRKLPHPDVANRELAVGVGSSARRRTTGKKHNQCSSPAWQVTQRPMIISPSDNLGPHRKFQGLPSSPPSLSVLLARAACQPKVKLLTTVSNANVKTTEAAK